MHSIIDLCFTEKCAEGGTPQRLDGPTTGQFTSSVIDAPFTDAAGVLNGTTPLPENATLVLTVPGSVFTLMNLILDIGSAAPQNVTLTVTDENGIVNSWTVSVFVNFELCILILAEEICLSPI